MDINTKNKEAGTSANGEKKYESPSGSSVKRKFENDSDDEGSKRVHVEGIGAVVAAHYNQREERGLLFRKRSKIYCLRNLNNWIKTVLIDQFVNKSRPDGDRNEFTALDMGCGKGGDIFKWKKKFVSHVIFTDIAESSIQQCKERYSSRNNPNNRMFSAEFLVADFTRVRLRDHITKKVNMVSCQFSLHYAFESLQQAEQTICNVSENLHSGGHFIATIPNAYKIMAKSEKMSKSNENGCSTIRNDFGNDVFKISFNKEGGDFTSKRPLFGDKYHFRLEGVVDCPEFLVYLPTLIELCKKYDLECVFVTDFEDIFDKYNGDRNYRELLNRMECLEKIPRYDRSEYSCKEYEAADRHRKESGQEFVDTLSLSEWEAICLYVAVGFRKK